jgi:hypothetical protein
MKDSTMLILAGGALAAYYFLFAKPKQEAETAFAGGAGMVSAIPGAIGATGQGLSDWVGSLFSGLGSLIPATGGLAWSGAPGVKTGQIISTIPITGQVPTWGAAGGTTIGRALVMPAPAGQVMGLTVQQPAITQLLQPAQLTTITTLQDAARVLATRTVEADLKAKAPGSTVIGHRTQGGVEIYTLKSPTGVITTVRQ